MLGSGLWRTLLLRLLVADPLVSGLTECSMLWCGLLILIYVICRMKCESLQSIDCFTEWNGSKRVDLRFWKTDTIPIKVGVSLSLPQWKVLHSALQVVDDLIS
jgi:hypothetical protein